MKKQATKSQLKRGVRFGLHHIASAAFLSGHETCRQRCAFRHVPWPHSGSCVRRAMRGTGPCWLLAGPAKKQQATYNLRAAQVKPAWVCCCCAWIYASFVPHASASPQVVKGVSSFSAAWLLRMLGTKNVFAPARMTIVPPEFSWQLSDLALIYAGI